LQLRLQRFGAVVPLVDILLQIGDTFFQAVRNGFGIVGANVRGLYFRIGCLYNGLGRRDNGRGT
jgi:hypothetical protein